MPKRSDFSVTLTGDDLPEFLRLVPMADRLGFRNLGVGDCPSLYHDVYVKGTLAAQQTRNIRIGPYVTNPVTRHPSVTAGAAATLDEVSGGRAFLGVGGGDSALYNIGLKGAGVSQIEEYVRTVRDLYQKHEVDFQGRNVRLAWTKRPVPVYMAASGPKGLRAAGRCADGVIVGTGVLPEVVADVLAQIDAGAKESGRRVEDLDIWWLLMGGLDQDANRALDDVKHSLTTYANLAFRFSIEGKHLPAQYHDAVRRIHQEYKAKDHVTGGSQKEHSRLADETGLTQYLASRFSLAGTPHQVLDQIARANRAGARQLWITLRFPGKERFFRLWEEGVAPALD